MQTIKELLAAVAHGEQAPYVFFLRENCNETVEEACAFANSNLSRSFLKNIQSGS